jgi:hypothetical protein
MIPKRKKYQVVGNMHEFDVWFKIMGTEEVDKLKIEGFVLELLLIY